jgi:4-hydroxy-2-oxovalerate aldolase
MIKIIENTLRDGSYMVNFQFTGKNTYDITKGLNDLGFEYIEIGHGLGLGAWNNPAAGLAKEDDKTYIQNARKAATKSKIGVFFIPGIGTENDIKLAASEGVDFIRIGVNIDHYQTTETYARLAKNLGLTVAVNLMKSYAVKSYEFTKIVSKIDQWQLADMIYLVDSAGCMLPKEVFEYIDRTKEKVQTALGFHGHDNLSLAIANTMEAINAGATYVDTCVKSMGRSAGNAQTEIAVYLLQKLKLIDSSVNLYKLYEFANKEIVPLMKYEQGLTDDEIHIGVSRFHTSYMPLAEKIATSIGVDKKKLIKKVSDINCLNPGEDLFTQMAKQIKNNG